MDRTKIDINCDMGEGFGVWSIGHDDVLMSLVSSANIACGMHAGDPGTMRATVRMAKAHGVSIGAHPSYPDLLGFGRRAMELTPDEVYETVLYQTGALEAIAKTEGMTLHHVKPHGALYNKAAKDPATAEAIVSAVCDFDRRLLLYGLPGSEMERAAQQKGLPFLRELFADRRYMADGSLMPRNRPGAVLEDVHEAVAQVVKLLTEGCVKAADGQDIALEGDTFCIHGDGAHAVGFAKAVRQTIEGLGMQVASIPNL